MLYFTFKGKECFPKTKWNLDLFVLLQTIFCSSFFFRTFYFQAFAKFGIVLYAIHFLVDDGLCVRLYLVVVTLYLLDHDVIAVLVPKGVDNRNFPICFFLRTDLGMVHDNFCMENFLVNLFSEVVRY